MRIGVLAIQGAFREHCWKLEKINSVTEVVEVRCPDDLFSTSEDEWRIQGLIIPGGESTTIAIVAERWNLMELLRRWIREDKPIWGTCAGMILLADEVVHQKSGGQSILGGLNISVCRNYYGSQVASFESQLRVSDPSLGQEFRQGGIFIRAPGIVAIKGENVQVLATVEFDSKSQPCAVKQRNILATAFHPELSSSLVWHEFFVNQIVKCG